MCGIHIYNKKKYIYKLVIILLIIICLVFGNILDMLLIDEYGSLFCMCWESSINGLLFSNQPLIVIRLSSSDNCFNIFFNFSNNSLFCFVVNMSISCLICVKYLSNVVLRSPKVVVFCTSSFIFFLKIVILSTGVDSFLGGV